MHGAWGISDHTFVNWYVVVAAIVAVTSMVYRYFAFRRFPGSSDAVDAYHAGFLTGGPQLAVYAALSELRRAGAVDATPNGVLSPAAPLPVNATRLGRAIYGATTSGVTAGELNRDPAVATSLTSIRSQLEEGGFLLTPTQRARARWFVYAQFLVVGMGMARVATDLVSGAPVGKVLSATVLIGLLTAFAVTVPKRTLAGRAVLSDLRRRHSDLAPPRRVVETGLLGALLTHRRRRHPPHEPPLDTPAAAAIAVALFGGESLYALDPTFASAIGVPRHRPQYDAVTFGGT
ncbi:TIGR04222 domain-containing membrane protein [Mycobacterium yunnanensis]|uniref:TIGR04222 domain-containing membrane protein n=1 Tax=Mycobacterium yunnanensis TaxID=368477 RepID=A0A9X2Z7N9_9MYCO|nr:TIGR04222 domain-containing membrane protein [Mycobacterium yunnanensis]MCV7423506.1 TIGR04222 domain-containing membrane protein [Mycobacterium yunnanensis]